MPPFGGLGLMRGLRVRVLPGALSLMLATIVPIQPPSEPLNNHIELKGNVALCSLPPSVALAECAVCKRKKESDEEKGQYRHFNDVVKEPYRNFSHWQTPLDVLFYSIAGRCPRQFELCGKYCGKILYT